MILNRHAKNPGERVTPAVAVHRQQRQDNNQRGIALRNPPRHQRATQDLVTTGSDAVTAPRARASSEHGHAAEPVDDGVANDIAYGLRAIGDPRSDR